MRTTPARCRTLYTLTVALTAAAAAGCGTAAGASISASTTGVAHGALSGGWTPPAVSSRLVHNSAGSKAPGTAVANSNLGVRVLGSATVGYSLATVGSATYPARTANARTWTIAGPVLHAAAAQGPLGVDQIGVRGADTAFAWEGAAPNTVVDLTSDAGRHWWRAFFPGSVLFVGADGGQVLATVYGSVTQRSETHTGVWVYRTANGRSWTYSSAVH